MFANTIDNIKNSLEAKIFFSVLIIIILGSIVLLITFYLINSIAINILRPIKMMNSILIGINTNNKSENEEMNNHNSNNSNSELAKFKKINAVAQNKKLLTSIPSQNTVHSNLIQGKSNNNNVNAEKGNNINLKNLILNITKASVAKQRLSEEENEFENEDDDLLDIRSEDIDLLFQTLIDLKKTLFYVQSDRYSDSEYKMINLLFAKNTFHNVNNKSAEFLCNSNLGNLALKYKKYDKAILHLWQSIKFQENYISFDREEQYDEYMKLLKKGDEQNKYKFDYCHISLFENTKNNHHGLNEKSFEIEMEKKINLESRLPKLIFAFKKFFKSINKLLKLFINQAKSSNINDNIDEIYKFKNGIITKEEFYYINRDKLIQNFLNKDFFTKNNYHSLVNFKTIIDQYIGQAIDAKSLRIQILGKFELIEFLIKYVMKPMEYNLSYLKKLLNTDSKFLHNNNNQETEIIEKYNSNLVRIEKIDKDLKTLKQKVYEEVMHTKDMIKNDNKDTTEKYLVSKKLSKKMYLEYSDLPKCVLYQKINYLHAKLNSDNNIKESFMLINSITNKTDDVIDGIVLISAYKTMIKLLDLLADKLDGLLGNIEFKNEIIKIMEAQQSKKEKDKKSNNGNNNIVNNFSSNNLNNLNYKNSLLMIDYIDSSQKPEVKDFTEEYIKEVRQRIKNCKISYKEEIANFSITAKDIVILLDYSYNIFSDRKKRDKSTKFFDYIFEHICTFNDRISLFGYNMQTFQLLSLIEKNNKTITLIKSHIKEIFKHDEFFSSDAAVNEENELVKAILHSYNIIGKKDIYNRREKWIIVLTDSIALNDIKLFEKDFSKNYYGDKKNENLIIVRFKFSKDEQEKYIMEKVLSFNKSCYIELDKKHEIKTKMSVKGVINESAIFDNEVYNP